MTHISARSHPLLVTVDVEDHGGPASERRFRTALEPLLSMLQDGGLKATFFVVGSLASSWADELRSLNADGHEIGLHGHTHQFITKLGQKKFAEELRQGRDALSQILGDNVAGFRAPYFSLTRATPWAPDEIANAGFSYSSSVLPVWNPQAGYPGAPKQPFRWGNGLVEFPVPTLSAGPIGLPVMGGAYLRLVPWAVVRFAERITRRDARWVYSHPYDFDSEEPFHQLPGQSRIVSKLLFARRALMIDRVRRLTGPGATLLGAYAADAEFVRRLPTYGET